MNIADLEALKGKMAKEARKWVSYLGPLPAEEAEKELTRKLLETWLEGHQAPR